MFIQVQVQRQGRDKKFVAKVLAVRLEWDLALLTVKDDDFWTGLEQLPLGDIPCLKEDVSVVGYPMDGTFCVTSGVVSRLEVCASDSSSLGGD